MVTVVPGTPILGDTEVIEGAGTNTDTTTLAADDKLFAGQETV